MKAVNWHPKNRSVARGDFRADIDADAAMDMLFGPIIYRLLAGHQPLTKAFAKSLTDAALNGICKTPR